MAEDFIAAMKSFAGKAAAFVGTVMKYVQIVVTVCSIAIAVADIYAALKEENPVAKICKAQIERLIENVGEIEETI